LIGLDYYFFGSWILVSNWFLALSQILRVSDELYSRLERVAHKRGLENIEQLLEEWGGLEDEQGQRASAVNYIPQLRTSLIERYGQMPDSTPLVREDRER
jgi:hypothetical protein